MVVRVIQEGIILDEVSNIHSWLDVVVAKMMMMMIWKHDAHSHWYHSIVLAGLFGAVHGDDELVYLVSQVMMMMIPW